MTITPRQLNRATLERQGLLHREPSDVVGTVKRILALQAQEAASPYIALWNRVAGFDPAELDTAFADASIVKTTLMRITLHAVAADDHPTLHAAMQLSLRASRLFDRRFTSAGMSVPDVDAVLPELLDFASIPRTNAEIESMLTERLGVAREHRAWWALRTFAPFRHAPTGGPWSFGLRPSYVAADAAPSLTTGVGAVAYLIVRFLEAFGPATVRDIGQFASLPISRIREAMPTTDERLHRLTGPDGVELLDVTDATVPPEDTPAPPRLMAMWDSVLLAYADRSRVIPPEVRPHVIRVNGDVLPTVLVDGLVAGVWRPTDGGIEITAFAPLNDETWDGLEHEARSLYAFLADRDPAVYRRYAHWWSKLPNAEIRVVAG